jgi:hypothetical protein
MIQEILTYLIIAAAIAWTFNQLYVNLIAKKKSEKCSSGCGACSLKNDLLKKRA